MAEKKKQHYVPKLLLRLFSTDDNRKQVNVFNTDNLFYRENCHLDSQAQEDYFYGKDGVIEDKLGNLENKVAPILKKIIENKVLPKKGTKEYITLLLFSFFLAYRTKVNVDEINEIVDKTFQEIIKLDSSFEGVRDKGIHCVFNNAAPFILALIEELIPDISDLEPMLLINNTTTKFFISDHPAVKYNQFLEHRNYPNGTIGVLTKGLQMFLPISPNVMISFFDGWAYKYGNKKDKVIIISNKEDAEQLNFLQVVNCKRMIYSSNSTTHFELLNHSKRAKEIRKQDRTKFEDINQRYTDEKGHTHIFYSQYNDDRRVKLSLTFIKQRKQARIHKMNDFVAQIRDESKRFDGR